MKTTIAITAVVMSLMAAPAFACVNGTHSGDLVCRDGVWHHHALSFDPKTEALHEKQRRADFVKDQADALDNFNDKQRHDLDLETKHNTEYDKNHKE